LAGPALVAVIHPQARRPVDEVLTPASSYPPNQRISLGIVPRHG
jgi:hypothetical protein